MHFGSTWMTAKLSNALPRGGNQVHCPQIEVGQSVTLEGGFSDELHIPEFPLFRFQRFDIHISPVTVTVNCDADPCLQWSNASAPRVLTSIRCCLSECAYRLKTPRE